ncbi:hypothetical protein BpHYR1_045532, partial [Brachionus plicatilis]
MGSFFERLFFLFREASGDLLTVFYENRFSDNIDEKSLSNSELSKLITNGYRTERLDQERSSAKAMPTAKADQYYSTHIDQITSELLSRCVSNRDLNNQSDSSSYSSDDTDIDDLEARFLRPFGVQKPSMHKNYVLKICNQMRSLSFVDQDQVDAPASQTLQQAACQPAASPDQFGAAYFDKSSNDDFEYEYTEIIVDDFRKVLDRYDGTVTADHFIKKQLPSAQFLANQRSQSSQKILDMYLILKRMLTKKKYVEATIRSESRKSKIKRNMNSSSSLKSRPSTGLISASEPPDTKQFRPKIVNLIPMKQGSQMDHEDIYDTVDDELNERLDAANYYYYTDVARSDYECYYEPFKLDLPGPDQQWPFELEFELEKKKAQRGAKPKCNSCKKLPSIKSEDKSRVT